MKIGVSILPWGVVKEPRRADPSFLSILKSMADKQILIRP
jgi:hypothetical protein